MTRRNEIDFVDRKLNYVYSDSVIDLVTLQNKSNLTISDGLMKTEMISHAISAISIFFINSYFPFYFT